MMKKNSVGSSGIDPLTIPESLSHVAQTIWLGLKIPPNRLILDLTPPGKIDLFQSLHSFQYWTHADLMYLIFISNLT